MNTITITTASNSNGTWYYNHTENRFDNSSNFSVSDRPSTYEGDWTESAKEVLQAEFGGMAAFTTLQTETVEI